MRNIFKSLVFTIMVALPMVAHADRVTQFPDIVISSLKSETWIDMRPYANDPEGLIEALSGAEKTIWVTEDVIFDEALAVGAYDGITLLVKKGHTVTFNYTDDYPFNIMVEDGAQIRVDKDITLSGQLICYADRVTPVIAVTGDEVLTLLKAPKDSNLTLFGDSLTVAGSGITKTLNYKYQHNQYLAYYDVNKDNVITSIEFNNAIIAMNSLGKSLIIDQPVDLGGETVDCLGVGLVWLSEGNIISNGTLNNCKISSYGKNVQLFSQVSFGGSIVLFASYPEWFGAKGDLTEDDSGPLNEALNLSRLAEKPLLLSGQYYITSPTDVGDAVDIIGTSRTNSGIEADFSTPAYVFEFDSTNKTAMKEVKNFFIRSATQYNPNVSGVKAFPGYVMNFSHLVLSNLNEGINLDDSWGSQISVVRALYCANPITVAEANGVSIRDIYILRVSGVGIYVGEGYSTVLDNIIVERGTGAATGIRLRATHSCMIRNLYTEGDMDTDIHLALKNGGACLNTKIEGLWLNSTSTKLIHAQAYRGLTVDDVTLQTPVASELIHLSDAVIADSPIHVGYVCQVDINANDYQGDQRSAGQTLIPLSDNNKKIILTKPFPATGNYTDADLTNIANFTVKDVNGYFAYYTQNTSVLGKWPEIDGDYTGYFQRRTLDEFEIFAGEPGGVDIQISAEVTESVGSNTNLLTLTNLTNGKIATCNFGPGTTTPTRLSCILSALPLEKGVNNVKMEIQRKTNDGGTTTLAGTRLLSGYLQ